MESATGTLPQPAPPNAARSVNPSLSKSPVTTFTPGVAAQLAKSLMGALETVNNPFPFDAATGTLPQPSPNAAEISPWLGSGTGHVGNLQDGGDGRSKYELL